ncbi:MAG: arcadin 1 [Candidatus Bathyarchaeia archaeon]
MSGRIRLKVSSVRAVRDAEMRESYQIEFVEVREKPPMVMMTPQEVPKEISDMMVEISRGVQRIIPGAQQKQYEVKKMTLILTAEELEAFKLKPYPNQIYELAISDGALNFKET